MSLDNVHEHLELTWTSLQSAAELTTKSHEALLGADSEMAEIEAVLGTVMERLGELGVRIASAWSASAESQRHVYRSMQSAAEAAEELNGGSRSILSELTETITGVHKDGGDRLGQCIGLSGRQEASAKAVAEAAATIVQERRRAAAAAVGATAQQTALNEAMVQTAEAKTAIGAE